MGGLDAYDLAAESGHAADYLARAKHDRVLADGGKLRAEVERQAPLGEGEFRLPPAPGRKMRIAGPKQFDRSNCFFTVRFYQFSQVLNESFAHPNGNLWSYPN